MVSRSFQLRRDHTSNLSDGRQLDAIRHFGAISSCVKAEPMAGVRFERTLVYLGQKIGCGVLGPLLRWWLESSHRYCRRFDEWLARLVVMWLSDTLVFFVWPDALGRVKQFWSLICLLRQLTLMTSCSYSSSRSFMLFLCVAGPVRCGLILHAVTFRVANSRSASILSIFTFRHYLLLILLMINAIFFIWSPSLIELANWLEIGPSRSDLIMWLLIISQRLCLIDNHGLTHWDSRLSPGVRQLSFLWH